MCEFAKEIKLNNADKQKCNGNFVPNEKEYKKEVRGEKYTLESIFLLSLPY